MKIVLVNYHHFVHGGPDRYFFNVKALLEREGHTVVPFCFDYDETLPTEHRHYFPTPISGRGTFLLGNLRLSRRQKASYLLRMFHNREVDRKFREMMQSERPDLVYSVYLSSSMLPNILRMAKRDFGVPVLYRLSDFHMFCASYLFFREGCVCTECLSSPNSAVRNRCVQGSWLASMVRVAQMLMIRSRRWYDAVDAFVCPSRIMQKALLDAGFPAAKVNWVPTFTGDLQGERGTASPPFILYFGKLNQEKGSEVLVRAYNAWERPQYKLRLIGHCSTEYRGHLLSLLDERHRPLVSIEEPLQGDAMWQAVRDSAFVVQPALWLENMPNALLEALSAGKPVIASEIGSLTELVQHGENGYLVPPGDVGALTAAIEKMSAGTDLVAMGAAARRRYLSDHTEQRHLDCLLTLIERVRGDHKEIL